MCDRILTTLLEALAAIHPATSLWVLDADVTATNLAKAGLDKSVTTVMTNRFEQAEAARSCGFDTCFSDYDFKSIAVAGRSAIAYRVGKDKSLVHHIINSAGHCLAPGDTLLLAGGNNEGFGTYRKKAAHYLGGDCKVHHLGSGSSIARLTRSEHLGESLEDRHYADFVSVVDADGHVLASKHGIFGYDRVDQGSALLLEAFRERWPLWYKPPQAVLDLGCGYGLLAVSAALACNANVVATDHNLAAVTACRRNFDHFSVPGRVVADDCATGISEHFDTVLCNPPFHRGFAVAASLTGRFVSAAANHLLPGGRALFVVNEFIPIERVARQHFGSIELLRHQSGFQVFELTHHC